MGKYAWQEGDAGDNERKILDGSALCSTTLYERQGEMARRSIKHQHSVLL